MSKTQIISSRQIKAARALLDWSQDDLAEASGLSIATIRKIEAGNTSPRGKTNGQLRQAIETTGIELLERDGVQRKQQGLNIFKGKDGVIDFFDDVYVTATKAGGEILIVCPNAETFFSKALGDYQDTHVNRMQTISDKVDVKCILTEKRDALPGAAYCEYRFLSQNLIDSVSFYIYGEKCSIRLADNEIDTQIMSIQSKELVSTYKRQFYSMWDKAMPLSKPKKRK